MDCEDDDNFCSGDGGEVLEYSVEDINQHQLKRHYKILTEEQIREIQDTSISDVTSVLSVSRGVACTLLYQNNWILTSVYDKWFGDDRPGTDPESARPETPEHEVCKICCETISPSTDQEGKTTMLSAGDCGHRFCSDCWRTYVSISIKDGSGCLTLPCPEPGCKTKAGVDLVNDLASADEKRRYYRYLARSYVECNPRTRKWCPAPGCELAIEVEGGGTREVECGCGHRMCFRCGEERHSPVDCRTVGRWVEKNSSEAENTKWIMAHTKPCPKCRRPIEKNQGCNRMRCGAPCRFGFCWLCLQPITGFHKHTCNKYGKDMDVNNGEENCSVVQARKYIERYTHYYERWASNNKSWKMALTDLSIAKNKHVNRLMKTQDETAAGLRFVLEAWEQVAECRRVLKWTYPYGYYLAEGGPSAKLGFFEHLQGEAESALERLHYCAEKETRKYLAGRCPPEDFKGFRSKLTNLTVVTRNYFKNVVRALENNLLEVAGAENKKKRESYRVESSSSTRIGERAKKSRA